MLVNLLYGLHWPLEKYMKIIKWLKTRSKTPAAIYPNNIYSTHLYEQQQDVEELSLSWRRVKKSCPGPEQELN